MHFGLSSEDKINEQFLIEKISAWNTDCSNHMSYTQNAQHVAVYHR